MGASTHDLSGRAGRPEPATPASYGEAPAGYRLPEATRLGAVRLQVADLARSVAFYEEVLGLRVVDGDAATAALAPYGTDRVLVRLHESPGAAPAGHPTRLGLYHFAILLPDRPSLGRFVGHLGELGMRAGAGDHLVSEAFYLSDPDGLGIEVYADRPRETWRRIGRELMMATDPVDVRAVRQAAGDAPWTGTPAGTIMGHVHLHVGDLGQARSFFSEALGFDRTNWSYPGALFLGAGGYHHHVGANTWAGSGARPAGADDARLLEWTIELPSAGEVAAAARSLTEAGYAAETGSGGSDVVTADPWGTRVRLCVGSAAPPAAR